MKFSGLTKKGRAYLAKCQAASTPIQFTKMKFGDGKLIDNENPADLTDIKNIKIEKSILSKEQKGDAVVLTTIIDNVSLEQGYFPRETGIYVLDEGVEVLYFYMNDGDETSWIPPEADGPHRMEVKINLISSNTGSVVVHNDGKDLYITKEYLEANYTQKGEYDGTAQSIEDRVVAAVGQLNGMFPLSEAIAGNVYYHQGNKKFYICKSNYNGTTISVPNMNFEDLSIWENRKRLENLKRKAHEILYAGGSPVPVGTSGKLPDYVTYNNILDYYFKIRFFGGVSFYIVLDNSTNTNIVNYTLFNGIKFQLDINTNILKLVADPQSQLISISVFNKLT
ncbi:phage tail protein [Fusobacterium animalis]|uniref:phage tail-collar fiber domain-containing protein n=1 Tax=Fusobacterium animalis TaxID=76859 RepID=UPI0030D2C4F6